MLEALFINAGFIPHGYCLSWEPGLVGLHLVSDIAIAASYLSIPCGIFYFLRHRDDFPYRRLAIGFAVFIVCCGLTHLFSAVTLWLPYYGVEGIMKAVTGLVSLMTAVSLWPMLPRLIALPSPQALREANRSLEIEIAERRHVENELREARSDLEQAMAARTAALKATESRLRAAVEAAVNAVIVIDQKGTIETFNRAAEAMFGYSANEAIGQNVRLLMPQQYADEHDGYLQAYVDTGVSKVIGHIRELTGQRRDGSTFPIELSVAEAVPNETFVGTVTDITERKQAEAELMNRDRVLREQADLLQGIFDNINHGIAVRDPGLRMVTWNRHYEEMFPQPEWLLKPGVKMAEQLEYLQDAGAGVVANDDDTVDNNEVLARLANRDGNTETNYDLRDGRSIIISHQIMPDGRNLFSYIDVTELKQYQAKLAERAEQLERSNQELEQFAYVASHDLQEPLRMVRSYCELLRHRYHGKLDDEADEFIDFAVDGANRMQELIDELLRLSRVGTGAIKSVAVDCNQLMQQVRRDLEARIVECSAELVVEPLPVVMGDPALLRQVLQNLVGNALKFHGDEAVNVMVRASEQEQHWMFCVEDNGIGIKPKYADRIFTIFQRLHTREAYPGTGMGLSICRKIIERHGGTIWLDTEFTDGARFCFTLPRKLSRNYERPEGEDTAG